MEKLMKGTFIAYRILFSIFSATGLVILLYLQTSTPTITLWSNNLFTAIPAWILMILGGAVLLISLKKYFFQLSGIAIFFRQPVSDELKINGINKWVRHPLYLGTLIFIWGFWLYSPTLLLLIVNSIITIYTIAGAYIEEKKLVTEFGKSYSNYQEQTPMLFPLIPFSRLVFKKRRS